MDEALERPGMAKSESLVGYIGFIPDGLVETKT